MKRTGPHLVVSELAHSGWVLSADDESEGDGAMNCRPEPDASSGLSGS